VKNLCIMNCRGFVDLLFDHLKCVHCSYLNEWKLTFSPFGGSVSPFLQSFASLLSKQ
jgi:hypothetical protein